MLYLQRIKRSSTFQFDIWLTLTLLHWICDFGRGLTALYVSDAFPMSLPSIGDYGHMVYNVMTGFCMLYILRRCIHPVPNYVQVSETLGKHLLFPSWGPPVLYLQIVKLIGSICRDGSSLMPRLSSGRRKRAWYTPFVHVINYFKFLLLFASSTISHSYVT